MSKLLEIFGRGITVDTADLIRHWLVALQDRGAFDDRTGTELNDVLDLLGEWQLDQATAKLKFHLYEHPDCVFGRMAAAAICLRRNEVADAIEQLQSVYARQPSNTMALYALGHAYERLDNTDEAVAFYQDCIKFKGHLQLPRQRLAAIDLQRGRTDRAIAEYEALVAEHPDNISSIVLLGCLYQFNHQPEKAVDAFNMAIVSHPDNFHDDADADQVEFLIQTGQVERALENVQWLLERIGPMPDLYVRMGDILSRAGRPQEAVTHYENALRLQPNYLEATIKLGTHYLRLGRYALAAEQFNRGVEINDEIVDAYIGLAVAQHAAGARQDTLRTLSLAGAIQQNSTLLFSETAVLHLQSTLRDMHASAENTFDPVLEPIPDTDPPTPADPTRIDRAALIEDVIRAHKHRMQNSPRSADIHYKFGMLMMVLNDWPKAVTAFDNALKINPTHHRALSKLALCLCETDRTTEAVDRLTAGIELDRETLDLHYKTAVLYCDRRRFARAVCALQGRMADDFTDPDARANIEVVLENLGLVDRAVAAWDRLTSMHYAIEPDA